MHVQHVITHELMQSENHVIIITIANSVILVISPPCMQLVLDWPVVIA